MFAGASAGTLGLSQLDPTVDIVELDILPGIDLRVRRTPVDPFALADLMRQNSFSVQVRHNFRRRPVCIMYNPHFYAHSSVFTAATFLLAGTMQR